VTQANGLDYHWAKQSPSLKLIDFAFLKAFQGMSYGHEDWFYPEQQRIRAAGLAAVGYYHFATYGSGADQADLFLARCKPLPGEWLWLDWEWSLSGTGIPDMTTAQAAAWHQGVAARFPNNPRGTYTSKNFLGGRSLPATITSGALWYVYAHGKPPQWDGWDFYQEVINNFDHDTYNGTWQELAARSGQSGGDDMTDEEHEWLQRDTRIMNGILTVFGSDPVAAGAALANTIKTIAGPAYVQAIAQAVVAALPPGGAPVDLDVLADLIVAKMGGKLST